MSVAARRRGVAFSEPKAHAGLVRELEFCDLSTPDQRTSCTEYCLDDRLDCVERRTQCTLDVVPLGEETRRATLRHVTLMFPAWDGR